MSDTKFTPGPWRARRLRDNTGEAYATNYLAHIDIDVCMVWAPEGNTEQEANAHLISAAPDLDQALADFCDHCRANGWAYGTAKERKLMEAGEAALAKARGEEV